MLDTHFVDRIGWTLVHSVWQILLLASLATLANRFLFRHSANARYLNGCLALLAILLAPLATFALTPLATPSDERRVQEASQPVVAKPESNDGLADSTVFSPTTLSTVKRSANRVEGAGLDGLEDVGGVLVGAEPHPTSVSERRPVPASAGHLAAWKHRVANRIQPAMSAIVVIWAAGVLLLSVRPLLGLRTVHRLRHVGRSDVHESITILVRDLCARMGIARTVEVCGSALLDVPAVVGSLRPLLLLPAMAVTGLTPQQLEAVIAHELAHVRRHDYVVNILQTLVETLLFYHPAVWWISRLVRQERENCCDDMALAVCNNRAVYANALVTLDVMRSTVPRPAIAANGGSLLQRIRRIAERDSAPAPGIWPMGAALTLAAVALFGGLWWDGVAATAAAELKPLDPSTWKATATLKVASDPYMLGEDVRLEFGVTNTRQEAIDVYKGGDSRGAPRALRLKVLAFDAHGQRVRDPYPMPTCDKGASMGQRLQPGGTQWLSFQLGRYCDFQKPGVYTLRVYHDLGWDERLPDHANELPSGRHIAPIAEAKITLVTPSNRQARRVVNQLAEGESDFTSLRQPLYLSHLLRLVNDGSNAAEAVRGIGEIATPEATRTLIRLVDHPAGAVSTQAINCLLERLPYPDAGKLASSPGPAARTKYLAMRAWDGKHRDKLVEVAEQLVASGRYGTFEDSIEAGRSHGLKIVRALCRASDYASFKGHVNEVISTNAEIDSLVGQLSDTAWTMFCDRAAQPPADLDRLLQIAGELDDLTFLRLLKARSDYRPDGWETRIADLLHESSPSVRLLATKSLPVPIPKVCASWIAANIKDRWGRAYRHAGELTLHPVLQIASLEVAERTRSLYFVPSIREAIEESPDARVLALAKRVLEVCTPPPVQPVAAQRVWPSPDFPTPRIGKLIERVKSGDGAAGAIVTLREMTGLDFGDAEDSDSRGAWSDWWSREQASIRNAAEGQREFLVYGRITDPQGRPLPRAWAQVDVTSGKFGRSGRVRVAYTMADNDGRYVLRFGFYKKTPGGLPIAEASVSTDSGDFALPPEKAPGVLVASRLQLEDDSILGIKKRDAIYPGQPVEINFTKYPTVRLRVDVVDDGDERILPEKLGIGCQQQEAFKPEYRALRLVKDEYYYVNLLPPMSVKFRLQETDESTPHESLALPLDRPGDYRVLLVLSADAPPGRKLRYTVVEAPANGQPGKPSRNVEVRGALHDWFRDAPYPELGFPQPHEIDRSYVRIASYRLAHRELGVSAIKSAVLKQLGQWAVQDFYEIKPSDQRRRQAVWAKARKRLNEQLDERQLERLTQLVIQQRRTEVFINPTLLPELQLSDKQLADMRSKWQEHLARVERAQARVKAGLFTSEARIAAGIDSYRRFWNEAHDLLTEEQRATFREFRGVPVTPSRT